MKWLTDGGRNTKYYHLKAVVRRRRNKILMLKDNNGIWIEDNDQIKDLVNSFYNDLFTIGSNWSC